MWWKCVQQIASMKLVNFGMEGSTVGKILANKLHAMKHRARCRQAFSKRTTHDQEGRSNAQVAKHGQF